jgi:hypothetical protein
MGLTPLQHLVQKGLLSLTGPQPHLSQMGRQRLLCTVCPHSGRLFHHAELSAVALMCLLRPPWSVRQRPDPVRQGRALCDARYQSPMRQCHRYRLIQGHHRQLSRAGGDDFQGLGWGERPPGRCWP